MGKKKKLSKRILSSTCPL